MLDWRDARSQAKAQVGAAERPADMPPSSCMDGESSRVAAASPRMQERCEGRSRADGRSQLVRCGTDCDADDQSRFVLAKCESSPGTWCKSASLMSSVMRVAV
jgi:hypothetical protein